MNLVTVNKKDLNKVNLFPQETCLRILNKTLKTLELRNLISKQGLVLDVSNLWFYFLVILYTFEFFLFFLKVLTEFIEFNDEKKANNCCV